MYRHYGIVLFILTLLLAGCNPLLSPNAESQLRGRILIWHPFEGREATVLNGILDQYTTLHPEVTIIREFVPETDMSSQFTDQAESGLGPDILINSYIRNPILIQRGLLQDLTDRNIDTSIYLPTSISQVRFRGRLYGLPLSLNTRVLCYNKARVDKPPARFHELVDEARAGRRVAVFSNFGATFWGVPALGGKLLDDNGRVILDQGGLVEWFELLKEAKNEPNFIFSNNEETILNTFAEGNLDYYVCWSTEIPNLQGILGKENVGVVPLPSPSDKPSSPFILTNALLFSKASADTELALQLARFLTNRQQQTKLALETESQIPANNQVKIDDRLSPVVAALVTQSKTAVPIPMDHIQQAVAAAITSGDVFYALVLEGEMDPTEAAIKLTETVNREFGFE